MTITYKKRKIVSPRIIAYIDGPFFPREGLSNKEKREDLRNQVFDVMNERAKNSNAQYIKYVKVGGENG